MAKINKAAAVLEMLNKGLSIKQIRDRMDVSPSYVHTLKQKMAHVKPEENDDNVVRPRVVAPHKVMRVTKEQAEAFKEAPLNPVEKVLNSRSNADEDPLGKLLDKRAEQYGSFMASANVAIRLKGVMHNAIAQQDLHLAPDQLLSLDMIAVKVSRILTGNPSHIDSWVDIAGYAKLVADRLQGNVR
jgi:transposase-like protein